MNKPLIYLASPYSADRWNARELRFRQACQAAAHVFKLGLFCYSPIAHTHPIKENSDLNGGWEYWQEYDRHMISLSNQLWILTLNGWRESVGVGAEVQIARELSKPIRMMTPQADGSYLIKDAG